jgi:hypothetical protein
VGGERAVRHRSGQAAQYVFADDIVAGRGEQNADRGAVAVLGSAQLVVHHSGVGVQPVAVFGTGCTVLQLEDDKSAEPQMLEEQIEKDYPLTHIEAELTADKGEPGAELGAGIGESVDQRVFQVPLAVAGVEREEVQIVGVPQDLPDLVGLGLR